MDFELPEELRLLKEQLRRFVDTEIIPIERDAYEGDMLKADVRQRLEARVKELGLWMFSVPKSMAGQGLGLLARTIIYEEMGRTIAIPYRKPNIFGPEPNGALYEASDYIKEKFLMAGAAWREADVLHADRTGRRLGSRRHAHNCSPRRQPLRHQRVQAVHHQRRHSANRPAPCGNGSQQGITWRHLRVHGRMDILASSSSVSNRQ